MLSNYTPNQVREGMLRLLFGVVLIPMLIATGYFSAQGLGLFTGEPFMVYLGYVVAVLIIGLEWYFNQGHTENKTMLLAGALAYGYSIWTTWVGLMGTADINAIQTAQHLAVIYFVIAVMFDVLPEAMIMYVLYGKKGLKTGDAIGALLALVISMFTGIWKLFFGGQKKATPKRRTTRRSTTRRKSATSAPSPRSFNSMSQHHGEQE